MTKTTAQKWLRRAAVPSLAAMLAGIAAVPAGAVPAANPPRPTSAVSDCAAVRAAAAHKPKGTRSVCRQVVAADPGDPNVQALSSAAVARPAKGYVFPSATCDSGQLVSHEGLPWRYSRKDACFSGLGTVTVYWTDEFGQVYIAGEMHFTVRAYAFMPVTKTTYSGSDGKTTWGYQVEFSDRDEWGDAIGSTIGGEAVADGAVTLASSSFAAQAMVMGGPVARANAFIKPQSFTIEPGHKGWGAASQSWDFTNPKWLSASDVFTLHTPEIRCDQALPVNNDVGYANNKGCVNSELTPTLTYSKTRYPSLASHVERAQLSNLPGAPGGTPLSRLFDPVALKANRDVACPSSLTRLNHDSTRSCDEYPFAATQQGAATPSGAGGGRSWPGCEPAAFNPGSTGPTGYSVCFVNSTENTDAGRDLGSMYTTERVLVGDEFYVAVVS